MSFQACSLNSGGPITLSVWHQGPKVYVYSPDLVKSLHSTRASCVRAKKGDLNPHALCYHAVRFKGKGEGHVRAAFWVRGKFTTSLLSHIRSFFNCCSSTGVSIFPPPLPLCPSHPHLTLDLIAHKTHTEVCKLKRTRIKVITAYYYQRQSRTQSCHIMV